MLVGATVAIAFLTLIVAPRADAFIQLTSGSPTSSGLSVGRGNLAGSGVNQNFIELASQAIQAHQFGPGPGHGHGHLRADRWRPADQAQVADAAQALIARGLLSS
jgi:hypothetical protein